MCYNPCRTSKFIYLLAGASTVTKDDPSRGAESKASLRVDISDFGPISKGKIRMKPLTILMGPHNSGKSYIATLIYSFLSSRAEARGTHLRQFARPHLRSGRGGTVLPASVKKLMREDSFTIPPNLANRIVSRAFAPIWKDAIEYSFGSPASELVRIGQKTAKITMTDSDVYKIVIADDARISVRMNGAKAHKCKLGKDSRMINGRNAGSARVLHADKALRTASSGFAAEYVAQFLMGSLDWQFGHPYYLPASRSAILQEHRTLAASLIQRAARAGIDRPEMPRMTEPVSEFISDLIDIPDRPGPFTALADDLERGLLGGRIGLLQTDGRSSPALVYKLADGDVPLHRSSSTVSEMAPLSLYLRRIVRKGDLLIIEEPEAHLHISSQMLFAKYIAKMIRQGLNLLITTHSFALMEAVNNHLIAGCMDPASRRKAGMGEGDYLLHEEVSPHLCSQDGEGGHRIAPSDMDEHGISLQEFVKITEPFYELGIKMDEWVAQNGS